ncbi:MAG: hypothetical protein DRQ51_05255 [Gammaproteobacteria bacterium]|nr:MAG: hypothetical protein DRQ51_05255 [Gammaproteobacteria bacterium]
MEQGQLPFVVLSRNCDKLSDLIQKYQIPVIKNIDEDCLELLNINDRLSLRLHQTSKTTDYNIDFNSGKYSHRAKYGGGKNQTLIKACGLNKEKNLKIIDCTAGFLNDSFVLANNGANLICIERFLPLYILLKNALKKHNPYNIQLIHGNAIEYLNKLKECVDVIYLDPMWQRSKNNAEPQKNMQLLKLAYADKSEQQNEKNTLNLLNLSLKKAYKVVLKRRLKNPVLQTPHHNLQNKRTRFDVYVN